MSPWPLRKVAVRATALGLIWGGFVWEMTKVATADSMLVAGIVMVGMMAGGAVRLAIVPQAAYGFVGSMAVISVAACLAHLDPSHGFVAAVLILAYAVFLIRHAGTYSADQIRNWRDRTDLAARNETISLLLNDFNDNSSDWVWEIDPSGRIRHPSARFREAVGDAIDGTAFLDLFASGPAREALAGFIASGEHFRELSISAAPGGRVLHWVLSGRRSGEGGYRGVASDVTEKVDAELHLAFLAHFDELTGLLSRARFREEVARAIPEAQPDVVVVLYCLDLDRFKSINDTMGHPFGDALLASVGRRLSEGLRPHDVVARLGGDEFAILRRISADQWRADAVGAEILALFDAPFVVGEAEIALNTSVGVRILNAPKVAGADELIRDADLALYRAKAIGRSCCSVFESDMTGRAARRLALEQALRTACSHKELSLFFQPYADMTTGEIVGLEALMRWHSPVFGPVSPDEFIPIAEESGLILTIGLWAISEALTEAAKWPAHLRVSVNLSPLQFRTPSLVMTVARELRERHFDPDRLELEITESTLLDDSETALASISSLKMLGVRVALDDFGTGYSSLSYLCRFPFDKIKIDKSFIRGVDTSPTNASVVKAIVDLGAALGMTITAEGIEEESQLFALRALGCHQMQGFLLARPMPAAEARDLVHAALPVHARMPRLFANTGS